MHTNRVLLLIIGTLFCAEFVLDKGEFTDFITGVRNENDGIGEVFLRRARADPVSLAGGYGSALTRHFHNRGQVADGHLLARAAGAESS